MALEWSQVGRLYCHDARDQLVFAQFSLNGMAHIGKGSPHVREMLACFDQTGMALEDGPVTLDRKQR
jgi:hypothetical protein